VGQATADITQVIWVYKIALPERDTSEYSDLVEQMFTESDTLNIATDITRQGGEWSPEDVRHQLIVWLVICAQRGNFPAGPIEDDYMVEELGHTPPG
jgi:hypothetical protein